ncbi:MAG: NUMOD4 domain-containing protein [Flavobacterium sp.]
MKETWKDIPEYDGKYQVDKQGNIRRIYQSGKTRLMNPYCKKTSNNKRIIVRMSINGKSKEEAVIQIVAKTFIGKPPNGCVPYHKNGIQADNYLNNIAYISKIELGRMTGASGRRKTVAKIDANGEMVDFYTSAREAARSNHMSKQTVTSRCNGKCKSAFAPDGYAYAWEDSEVSVKNAIRKIELEKGYMPKARKAVFEF